MLLAHGATHPGRRPTNEDAYLSAEALGLFVVADGMGGHNAGEVAADIAVRTIQRAIERGGADPGSRLGDAVREANREILAAAGRDDACAGMGTTVVAVLADERSVHVAGVGDSRAYLLRQGNFVQLTQDDTWVAHAAAEGLATGADHPMRHVLTKVVGLRPDLEVQVGRAAFETGDVLLLCSDGLHGALPDGYLADALSASGSAEETANALVADAVGVGATDNITVVVVQRRR